MWLFLGGLLTGIAISVAVASVIIFVLIGMAETVLDE